MKAALAAVPRGLWLGLLAMVVSAGLLFAPVATAPATRVLGNFQSETATHAPALAAALEGLFVHGPFVLADHPLHPEEVNGAMYEPITTMLLWPVYAVMGGGTRGFTLAWNVWHLLVLVGTGVGAWMWARAWLGEARDPGGWGAGTAMALASGSLFLHLSPEVGRTEASNYPLYALHAGLLFRAAVRPVGGGRMAWAWAALSAVPIVWSGGYGTVFFAIAEPLLAFWALSASPDRRRTVGGLLVVAVVSALAAAPLLWALQQYPYIGLAGEGQRSTSPSVAYAVLFQGSENLLQELPGYEVAPFAGLVTLLAAAAAILRGRSAAWPIGAGLLLYLVSAGPTPTVNDTVAWGPAALFQLVPGPIGWLRGWTRLFAFAIPFFAVAAAGLARGQAVVAVLIVGLGLGETAMRRVEPGSWWTFEEAPRLVAMRESGERLIVLPIDGIERARRWLDGPGRPDLWKLMPDHVLFRYFQDALPNDPELFRNKFAVPKGRYEPCALVEDAIQLHNLGFSSLYLRTEFLPQDGRGMATRALMTVFGTPRDEGVWRLPTRLPEACWEGVPVEEKPAVISLGPDADEARPGPRTPEERAAIKAAREAERDRVREERLKAKGAARAAEEVGVDGE
ncbi:MAG: hypothetical protein V4850_33500 [Myxococcota bacterium]